MKILLFDMDGVLLQPLGYHQALRETVRRLSRALGLEEAILSEEQIAAFEAGGIISEWDEAAVCAALLLEIAWKRNPTLGLPVSLAEPTVQLLSESVYRDKSKAERTIIGYAKANGIVVPDFFALARRLSDPELLPLHPLERAERYFLAMDHHTQMQERTLLDLFRKAHSVASITFCTFQELAVGSAEFSRTYGLPVTLDSDSYLAEYDRPNLSAAEISRLKDWLQAPDHKAVIFTSRPSHAPAGTFCPGEAELGAAAIGLKELPIAGWGGMYWLGKQRGVNSRIYLKPSPVHALTALRLALGDSPETALNESANLVEGFQIDPVWHHLDGAQVSVFEDTPGGIKSLKAAKETLKNIGIRIETGYFGVAQQPVKIEALKANEAQVSTTFADALKSVTKPISRLAPQP